MRPLQRHTRRRGELARSGRADPGSTLARRAFSRGRRRYQLPALFQHQRSGRTAHGTAGGVRSCPPAGVPPACERHAGRLAHRSRRRPAGSERISAAAARPGIRQARPSRFTWWWRRFWRVTNRLREDWPVDGTTGYEFANLVLGAADRSSRRRRIDAHLRGLHGEREPFHRDRPRLARCASCETRWRAN